MKALICIILSLATAAYGQVGIPCNLTMVNTVYTCRLYDVDLTQFPSFEITTENHLPGMQDTQIQSFISVNNNFQSFPTAQLSRFTGLQSIKITGSNIRELPAGSVANRGALITLNLNSNSISNISPAAFTGTTNIQNFHLMFNRLTRIDDAVFSLFPQLQNLDLSSNLITEVPEYTLNRNVQLTVLSLNANQIRFIDRQVLLNLTSLWELHFLTNPCHSESFINLQNPVFRNQMLSRLEPCQIVGPRRLFCNFNTQFPGDVSFDGLYTCWLRNVEFVRQDDEVEFAGFHLVGRNDTSVQFMFIDASNVRFVITQAFTRFPNLQGLRIQGTNFEFIQPGSFLTAGNLQELTISLNVIRRLESNSFNGATNLRILNLWFNRLEYIHEQAFHGLPNLRELHLLGGYITEIRPNTFGALHNLYLVEVGFNQLKTIHGHWFTNNTQIGQLLFNNNEIDEIFPEIVDMPNLTTLRLRNNVCVDNEFVVNSQTREQVRAELNTCFLNYPLRRQRFCMDVEGDLSFFNRDGNLVIAL